MPRAPEIARETVMPLWIHGAESVTSHLASSSPPSRSSDAISPPDWVHEIKHDGYRLIVRRDGAAVRSRNGYD